MGPVGIEPTTRGLKVRMGASRAVPSDPECAAQLYSPCHPPTGRDGDSRAVCDHSGDHSPRTAHAGRATGASLWCYGTRRIDQRTHQVPCSVATSVELTGRPAVATATARAPSTAAPATSTVTARLKLCPRFPPRLEPPGHPGAPRSCSRGRGDHPERGVRRRPLTASSAVRNRDIFGIRAGAP